MSDWMDAAEVAKLIREVLKDKFPGQKFRVNTSKYAGGASVSVRWTDGPGERAVSDAVGWFAGASFDGMTDLMSYLPAKEFAGRSFRSGANFVFCDRDLSPAVLERVVRQAVEEEPAIAEAGMPPVREDSSGTGWVDYQGYPWEATRELQQYVTDFWKDGAA